MTLKNTDKRLFQVNWIVGFLLSSFLLAPLSAEMVFVPKGKYLPFIKSDSKIKITPIKVNAFYLDKYPVTNAEYLDFISTNPKWKKGSPTTLFADNGYLAHMNHKTELSSNTKKDSPVTYVSWFAAKAYCESKGYRLPTEDEWEYASLIPPTGKNADDIKKKIMQWYSEKKEDEILPVGQYQNKLGVYDMHGLIWEWVYNFNSSSVTGDSRADGDIERGLFCGAGAIKANDFSDYAAYMRYGYRSSLKGQYTAKYLGFRCATNDLEIKQNKENKGK